MKIFNCHFLLDLHDFVCSEHNLNIFKKSVSHKIVALVSPDISLSEIFYSTQPFIQTLTFFQTLFKTLYSKYSWHYSYLNNIHFFFYMLQERKYLPNENFLCIFLHCMREIFRHSKKWRTYIYAKTPLYIFLWLS